MMETKKTIDMCKVNIEHQLDDSSAGALQNSLYLFRDFLEQADIPESGGDAVQDKNLRLAVNKWCKAKPWQSRRSSRRYATRSEKAGVVKRGSAT